MGLCVLVMMGIQEDRQGEWKYSILIIITALRKALRKPFLWVIRFTSIKVVLSYSLSPQNGLHFRTAQPRDDVLGILQNGLWEAETSFQDFRWKRLTENTYIETNTRCGLANGFLTKAIPHTATKIAIFVSYSLCDCSCFSFLQSQQR